MPLVGSPAAQTSGVRALTHVAQADRLARWPLTGAGGHLACQVALPCGHVTVEAGVDPLVPVDLQEEGAEPVQVQGNLPSKTRHLLTCCTGLREPGLLQRPRITVYRRGAHMIMATPTRQTSPPTQS